jgi:hypothetical protein
VAAAAVVGAVVEAGAVDTEAAEAIGMAAAAAAAAADTAATATFAIDRIAAIVRTKKTRRKSVVYLSRCER